MKKAKDACTIYSQQVRNKGKGHGLGAPHCHAALAAVEAAVEVQGVASQYQTVLRMAAETLSSNDQAVTAMMFPCFRVKDCHKGEGDKELSRVHFSVHPLCMLEAKGVDGQPVPIEPRQVRAGLLEALQREGGERQAGQAPRSHLERRVQGHLKD